MQYRQPRLRQSQRGFGVSIWRLWCVLWRVLWCACVAFVACCSQLCVPYNSPYKLVTLVGGLAWTVCGGGTCLLRDFLYKLVTLVGGLAWIVCGRGTKESDGRVTSDS